MNINPHQHLIGPKYKHVRSLLKAREFKGQKLQDRWILLEALPLKKEGFFLDLAAADGITHSNTYVLEKHFDWQGLCIEPNPYFYHQLIANRHCLTDSSVISNKNETVQFRVDNGQLGGIVAEDTDNSKRLREHELPAADIIDLEAVTINEVLIHHEVPQLIDYFSLDVEGSEERVISTLDFGHYTFNCITVERPTPKVNEILFNQGYLFVRNQRNDSFYIHPRVLEKANLELQQFEQVLAKDW